MQLVQQMAFLQLKLSLQHHHQMTGMPIQDLMDSHDGRDIVPDHQRVDGKLCFAIRVGIQGVDNLLGVGIAGQIDLDVHLFCGIVVDRADLQLALLGSFLHRANHRLAGRTIGKLLNYDAFGIGGVQLGANGNRTLAITVILNVNDTPAEEIRIQLIALPLQGGCHCIKYFQGVVGKNVGAHPYGDTADALDQDDGNLGREGHRLLVSSVIGVNKFSQLRVVQYLFCKGKQAALDVPCSRGTVTGKRIAEVALPFNEQVAVCQVDQGLID